MPRMIPSSKATPCQANCKVLFSGQKTKQEPRRHNETTVFYVVFVVSSWFTSCKQGKKLTLQSSCNALLGYLKT